MMIFRKLAAALRPLAAPHRPSYLVPWLAAVPHMALGAPRCSTGEICTNNGQFLLYGHQRIRYTYPFYVQALAASPRGYVLYVSRDTISAAF